jgi:hypothetical protein
VLVGFQTQAHVNVNIPKDHHRHLLGKKKIVFVYVKSSVEDSDTDSDSDTVVE